jgi:hypothetical protein
MRDRFWIMPPITMTPRNQNMSRAEKPGQDDQLFVHYFLGLLPEKDAERLDELSAFTCTMLRR